jgi:EAL domain-containing protein (putative c-di-GMP-specific phosphodiesterase class I)/CheY-like chemotaxis protein
MGEANCCRDGERHDGAQQRAGGRVLVVDDYPEALEFMARVLERSGIAVTRAANAEETLAAFQPGLFDAIVADIGLPDMNGVELLLEIRKRDLDVPVVFVTGAPSLETAMAALRHGALQYLTKPFAIEEFIAVTRRAIQLGRLAAIKRRALEANGLSEGLVADLAGTSARFEQALARIHMVFQPIVRAGDFSLYGFEALLRCADPLLRHPGTVLSAAEQLERVLEVGRIVRWRVAEAVAAAGQIANIFINLHPLDLFDPQLGDRHQSLSGIASQVVLEITERAQLGDPGRVAARSAELRGLGFRLAIDDLGSGYASLSSFVLLEPQIVKIDMSLVRDVDSLPTKRKLMRSLVDLCREMGIDILAEGVETEAECRVCKELGCDLMQGYLFGRPAPPFPPIAWPAVTA